MSHKKKDFVVIAMSGGVDSSVAASLLVKQGYQVIGVTMKLWEYKDVGGNQKSESVCCSIQSMNDARSVCQQLGIPHYVFDFREEFNRLVVNNFISEYYKGRTPNPCILCNTRIKWQTLWQKAEFLNAAYLATGHYARIKYDKQKKRYLLLKALSDDKDQAYALWGLTQDNLAKTLFPLGELTKSDVRKTARKLGLKTADKAESQEICFVPDNDYRRLLYEKTTPDNFIKPGEIVNTDGDILGEHPGYMNFTIGQRKGLGIALGNPVYVTDIRPETNQIIVGTKSDLFKRGLTATNINWIGVDHLEKPVRCFVKIRYKDKGCFARVWPDGADKVTVEFENPQPSVTPGQSVVFYQDESVMGGGIIGSSF